MKSQVALAFGAALSLAAGQSMSDHVTPWSVAVCAAAAAASGVAGRRMERAANAAWIFLAAAAAGVALSLFRGSAPATSLIALGVAVGIPWFAGRYLRQQDELVEAAVHRARLQERSRIAQDMHDSLGHELNLLALRAGAIEVESNASSTQQVAAAQLREGASSAIAQLATVIGVLRGEDAVEWEPPGADPAGLVRRAREAGLDAELQWRGAPDLTPVVGRCVHRVVQEGLTNAAKHAPGAPVLIRIEVGRDETTVTVANALTTTMRRRAPGSGTGLVALHERVRSCGGSLDYGPHDGGFEIVARVPHGEVP
jgi:signal transduction histidine kinase